ncbi:hypothetical protein MMC25_002794 [Agyrium rufum]|nr:hypothetical protein [Agyrium rufum]
MALTLPQFIYPDPGYATGGYTFNYVDSVNVSWYWSSAPANVSVGLNFWMDIVGEDPLNCMPNSSLVNRFNLSAVNYPVVGHYQLLAIDANGTQHGGPNSIRIVVNQDEGVDAVCNNCTNLQLSTTSIGTTTTSNTPNLQPVTATIIATVTPMASTLPQPVSRKDSSTGTLLGIIFGVLVLFTIACIATWLLGARHERRRKSARKSIRRHIYGSKVVELPTPAGTTELDAVGQQRASRIEMGTDSEKKRAVKYEAVRTT